MPAMRPLILGLTLAILSGAVPAQTPAPPAAQPAADPTLPDKLKDLKMLAAQPKMEDDLIAVDKITALMQTADKLNDKDKDKLARGLGELFRTGKVRPPDRPHLYRETAKALGKLGNDGGRELSKAVADARLKGREHAPIRAVLLVELGHTKDESQVDYLLDQALTSPDNEVMAAGGEALGNFTALEIRKRREVVKRLVSRLGEVQMKATQPEPTDPHAPIDFSPQNARETLKWIEGKWCASLAALTGQSFTTAPDWTHWLNKNRDWTPPGGHK